MFIALSKGRQAVLLAAWAVLAVGVTWMTADARAAAGEKKGDKSDLDRFQGSWTIASLTKDGMEVPEDFLKDIKVVITGEKMSINIMGKDIKATFKLDPTKKPKQIDLKIDDQKETGIGIYVIDGDTIKICASEGKDRPKEFKSDGANTLITLKKAKNECESEAAARGRREAPAHRGAKSDKDRLQGEWSMTKMTKRGQEAPNEVVQMFKISFKDDKLVLSIGGNNIECDCKIDDKKKPRQIDVTVGGKSLAGIYELDGDKLRLCMSDNETRPKEFKGDDVTLMVLKREKAPQQPAVRGKSDKDKLQGKWKLTAATKAGQEIPAEFVDMISASIKADKLVLTFANKDIEITFKIDETKKPRQIDMSRDNKDMAGIYELNGDVLKICIAEGNERPKEFKADDAGMSLLVFKRDKDAKQNVQAPAPAAEQAVARGKSDKERLKGTWKVKSFLVDGKDLAADFFKDATITFEGDKFKVNVDGKDIEGTYKLNDKEKPPHIDTVTAKNKGMGIYQIDGNNLKICLANPDKVVARPKEFKSDSGDVVMMTFERVKADKQPEQPAPAPERAAAQSPAAGKGKSDLDKMQGVWTVESAIEDGKELPKEIVGMLKFVVKDNTVKLELTKDLGYELKFVLDEKTKPKNINWSMEGKGPVAVGIYELGEDTIKFCLVELDKSKDRPTEFKAPAGSPNKLVVLKRAKNAKQAGALPDRRGVTVAVRGGKDKTDLDLLQGTWQVTSMTFAGMKIPEKETAKVQLIVKGEKITLSFDGKLDKDATFKLDFTKKPKQIDLMPDQGNKLEGIYELTGDTLKICAFEGMGRPTDFKSDATNKFGLMELKRVPIKKAAVDSDRPDFFVSAAAWDALQVAGYAARRPAAPVRGDKAKGKSDQERMQGNWVLVSAVDRKGEFKEILGATLKVDGDRLTVTPKGSAEGEAAKFKLDPSKSPMQIDLDSGKGVVSDEMLGIYEVGTDTLKLAFGGTGGTTKGRPTKFEVRKDSRDLILEFKRVLAKNDKQAAGADAQPQFVVFVAEEESGGKVAQEPKPKTDTEKKTDLQKLQGEWQPIAGFDYPKGEKMPADKLAMFKLSVAKERAIFASETGRPFMIKLEETKSPRHIDLYHDKSEKEFKGIYDFKGDTLIIAIAFEGQRPTKFKYAANDPPKFKVAVIEYKRPLVADQDGFRGIWKFAKARGDGEDAPGHLMADLRWVFDKDGKLTVVRPIGDQLGEYKLDPAKKHIDLIMVKGDKKETVPGIYKLDGDRLTLCFADKGKDSKRPVEFTAEKGTKQVVFELVLVERTDKVFATMGGGAARQQASNQLKQFAIAMHNYHDAYGRLPAHAIYSKDGKTPLLSWRVAILPYIEQNALYMQFKLDEPWDSPHNKKLIPMMPKIYAPVVQLKDVGEGMTFFQVVTGPNTMFNGPKGCKFADVSDGLSNTVMIVEGSEAVIWSKPDDVLMPRNSKLAPKLGAQFGDITPLALADGSVRVINRNIKPETLRAMITPSGGEIIDQDIDIEDTAADFVVFVSEESAPAQDKKDKADGDKQKKTDLELAQGEWEAVNGYNYFEGAKKMSKEELGDNKLKITKDQARIGANRDSSETYRFKFDESKQPKQFDLLLSKEVVYEGIYEVTADTLKVCFNAKGSGRPKSFKLDKTEKGIVIEFKRFVPIAEDKKPDLERFRGQWKFAKARGDGEDAPGHIMADWRWVFDKDGKLTLIRPQGEQAGQYQLDVAKKHIDLIVTTGDKKEVVVGIYKLDGQRLTLCFADKYKDAKRPVEFSGEKGSKQVVFELVLVERYTDQTNTSAGGGAPRAQTSNDLKQIALAMHNYHDSYKSLPAHAIYSKDGKTPLLSWRVAILPFIEQEALYKEFKLDEPWDSPHNKKLIAKIPPLYMPRVKVKDLAEGMTYHQVVVGPNTLFTGPKGISLVQITDGTSNTIMIVEGSSPVIWSKPDDVLMPRNSKRAPKLGGMFGDIMLVAYCDGSVRTMNRNTPPRTLRALITPNGGEIIDLDDD
jgi:uncharacterized protein (TIGR03067 family)